MTSWRSLLKEKASFPIVGVGVTAFNRVGPGLFLSEYHLACLKDSLDLPILKKEVKQLYCLQKLVGKEKIGKFNSLAILRSASITEKIASLGQETGIFVYKSSRRIEKVAQEHGWRILSNRAAIRDPLEDKNVFAEILEEIKVDRPPTYQEDYKELDWQKIRTYQKKLGSRLVLRLAEVTRGGGLGLGFVEKREDFNLFQKRAERLAKKYDLQTVLVQKFIRGPSPSITGCVTEKGILSGVIQTQILDQPLLVNLSRGSGLFCGHDWSFGNYSLKIKREAEKIVRRLGEYIYKGGYRGIFGLDLLVDEDSDKVYACECNPRYTGAFPVYTMLQLENNEPPLDAFHLLEHLKVEYRADIDKLNQRLKQPKQGSQLILTNKTDSFVKVNGLMPAGLYRFSKGEIKFLGPAFATWQIKEPQQFIWTDGCPKQGEVMKPYFRIGKLIFKKPVLKKDNVLKEEVKQIVKQVYNRLDLKKVAGF